MATSFFGYLNPMNFFASKEQPAVPENEEQRMQVDLPKEETFGEQCNPEVPSQDPSPAPNESSLEISSPSGEEDLQLYVDHDNLIQDMARIEIEDSPKQFVFDFCPGQRRMPYGQWWVPEGKIASDCTICEYCYENKCLGEVPMTPYFHQNFNISGKYNGKIPSTRMKSGNCNCDCPKAKEHPQPSNLMCPPCYYESLEALGRAAVCGSCEKCGNWISYSGMTYCPPCSHLFEACYECGGTIKEGNAYLEAIKAGFDKQIKRCAKYTQIMEDDWKGYYEDKIEQLRKEKEEVALRFKDKSAAEVLVMAKKNYKEDLDQEEF